MLGGITMALGLDGAMLEAVRQSERTGRPLGDTAFVRKLEAVTGRKLACQKPGPKAQIIDKADASESLV